MEVGSVHYNRGKKIVLILDSDRGEISSVEFRLGVKLKDTVPLTFPQASSNIALVITLKIPSFIISASNLSFNKLLLFGGRMTYTFRFRFVSSFRYDSMVMD